MVAFCAREFNLQQLKVGYQYVLQKLECNGEESVTLYKLYMKPVCATGQLSSKAVIVKLKFQTSERHMVVGTK